MSALTDLDGLLDPLPNASALSPAMRQSALNQALMPDSQGVWPGQPGYITTYDTHFAALKLVGFLRGIPAVRQASSEGTSTALDSPDWNALIGFFRSSSPIAQATSSSVLREVPIPGGPHVRRTDMSGGDWRYGDVDTDTA